LTFWTLSSPSERLSALGTCVHCRVAATASTGSPLMGFTLESAPLSFDLMRPLRGCIAAALRPTAATRPARSVLVVSHHRDGLLRIRLVSLLRLTTDRGSSLLHLLSRPKSWHPGVWQRSPSKERIPVGSPALLREQSLTETFQQPNAEASRNVLIHTPPPKRFGCKAARSARQHPSEDECHRRAVRAENIRSTRFTLPTQAPGEHRRTRGVAPVPPSAASRPL
jgi:hypothetical protein